MFIHFIIIGITFTISNSEKPKCPPNEYYSDCGNNCYKKCEDIGKRSTADCKECLKGCFCDSGFVRDRKQNNRCVKPVKCKGIRVSEKMLARNRSFNCGRNQIYKKCGTDCGQRCRDSRRRRNCHKWKCTSGGFCGKGYFRNKMNNCVKPDKCRTTTRFQLFPKNWKFWRK